MPLAKQAVQFFFGASDQDTSAKGVKLGDLVLAKNVQQVHPGEFVKRGGFAQTVQTFDSPSTITAESITSPDGIQVIIRDGVTDTAFARGTTSTSNIAKGSARRVFAVPSIRFPSLASGEQSAPMAKQAGDYYVWLHDESHFRIAKRSPSGGALLTITDPIVVNGVYGDTPSTHVKSFAVIDSAVFDADALWIFWVDWTTGVTYRDSTWGYRIPHATLSTPTAFRVGTGSSANMCCTSISVGIAGNNRLTICTCGAEGIGGGPAVAFRSTSCTSVDSFYSFQQISYTGEAIISHSSGTQSQVTGHRVWAASGCCMLTAKTIGAYTTNHFYFVFWGGSVDTDNAADLLLVDVTESTGVSSAYTISTVTNSAWPQGTHTMLNLMGQVTGYETANGFVFIAQHRIYYLDGTIEFVNPTDGEIENYPDSIFTTCWTMVSGGMGPTIAWTKKGAWLAHGYFTGTDGEKYIITGWEDVDGVQKPYHLRRVSTGEIVAIFAQGQGPHAGGCSTSTKQIEDHMQDLSQPMLQTSPLSVPSNQIVLAMESANVNGSEDIANITLLSPTMQNPVPFRDMALIPGPIPTVVSGWQTLREAGPLSFVPRVFFCWGKGSS
jgi:hypothetical protein